MINEEKKKPIIQEENKEKPTQQITDINAEENIVIDEEHVNSEDEGSKGIGPIIGITMC